MTNLPVSSHNGKAMACPVCKEPLHAFIFNNIELDICESHHCGIWFDHGELSAIELSDSNQNIDDAFKGEYSPKPLSESFAESPRCCPRDGSELEKYHWNLGSGIVFDRCTQDDGIWVDSGELEGYASYVKRFKEQGANLSPELQAKLELAQIEGQEKYDQSIVSWDIGLLDDMLRGMIKLFPNK